MCSPTRTPWPDGFPDVVVHTTVAVRDAHPAYGAAKAGDAAAALRLAEGLLDGSLLDRLRLWIGNEPAVLLPVIADETLGFNAIPDAMARVAGRRLALPMAYGDVVQVNKVGHTRAKAFQRLVTPAVFGGSVRRGWNYILLDDHVGVGGTLANLRGYVEAKGGRVRAITTLTEGRDARGIALRAATRTVLWQRYGEELERLWTGCFGHGIDCLTEVEARHLCRRQSVAEIQDFLAKAAIEARGRGLAAVGPG